MGTLRRGRSFPCQWSTTARLKSNSNFFRKISKKTFYKVTLNATHVLVADSQSSGATFLLDFDRRVWIEAGSSLSQSRDSAACGAVDSSEGGREVVVAGEGTAEIFSLQDMEW